LALGGFLGRLLGYAAGYFVSATLHCSLADPVGCPFDVNWMATITGLGAGCIVGANAAVWTWKRLQVLPELAWGHKDQQRFCSACRRLVAMLKRTKWD
jgi:hypothetical protein